MYSLNAVVFLLDSGGHFSWLLAEKDRDFLEAYFEVRGKWSDRQVNAMPVKSKGKGTFNIFKRVFELPTRLLTDTGEVILGQ